MPLCEVSFAAPLTAAQKAELAKAIADIHAGAFQTPRWFVNVVFTDASQHTWFVGGRPRLPNRITACVRNGAHRTREAWEQLCQDINTAWRQIVHRIYNVKVPPPTELELAAIFITGELLAGLKVGLPVPGAGEEQLWAQQHFEVFKQRSALGDEVFVDVLGEMEGSPWLENSPRS
ncbi:hypothetical protein CGCS363_v007239 [Colletotrichum siamense]|uniref:uncharacterized protein n=1 Tax=Colletotrichum siamense TaxID=690259 RepID=UPI00187235B4|nr:uncharacterized protein CGCS363_v007239 [Colletotrichum siamense]KAF5500111.1 hypothetical protein CGCS363_v007239 [Colletotrichum siamense]